MRPTRPASLAGSRACVPSARGRRHARPARARQHDRVGPGLLRPGPGFARPRRWRHRHVPAPGCRLPCSTRSSWSTMPRPTRARRRRDDRSASRKARFCVVLRHGADDRFGAGRLGSRARDGGTGRLVPIDERLGFRLVQEYDVYVEPPALTVRRRTAPRGARSGGGSRGSRSGPRRATGPSTSRARIGGRVEVGGGRRPEPGDPERLGVGDEVRVAELDAERPPELVALLPVDEPVAVVAPDHDA